DPKGNPMGCGQAASSVLGASPGVSSGSNGIAIARWGNPEFDNAVLTYNALSGSFQVQPVVTVMTRQKLDPDPTVSNSILIDKSATNQSVVQGSFTTTDRIDFHPDEGQDPLFDAVAFHYMV